MRWMYWQALRIASRKPLARMALPGMIAALVFVTVVVWGASPAPAGAEKPDAGLALRMALERASAAGVYQVAIDAQQTTYPVLSDALPGAAPQGEFAQFQIDGLVSGDGHARLRIQPGRVSPRIQLQTAQPQDLLVAGDRFYMREGDRWIEQTSASAAPGVNSDGLMLLAAARNAHWLDEIDTLAGRHQRIGFTLATRDVLRQMRGAGDTLLAEASGLRFEGAGELWIAADGLPARLILNLDMQRAGSSDGNASRTRSLSTAEYSNFGAPVAPGVFDPAVAPLSGVSHSPIPGLGVAAGMMAQSAVVALMLGLAVVLLALSRPRAGRPARMVSVALVSLLIAALVSPNVAEAAKSIERPAPASGATRPESAAGQIAGVLRDARDIAQRNRLGPLAAGALLDPHGDEDGDGLPNGYELRLGTSPFNADSDLDGLTDYQEVTGTVCSWVGFAPGSDVITQVYTSTVQTNPLLADSNSDGLRDGDEFGNGQCWYRNVAPNGRIPGPWHDDNDMDGVPDGIDLSPFSRSGELGGVGDYYDWNDPYTVEKKRVYFSNPGANLNFESIDSLPGAPTRAYPFYVELQVRPTAPELLRAAYKSSLVWPLDTEANIRNLGEGAEAIWASLFAGQDMRTSGRLQVVPFLQVGVQQSDLPSWDAMRMYGITATKETTCSVNCVYQMILPLTPVERNGQVFALQAKALHDFLTGDTNLFRRWRDMRLKWAVQGEVLRANAQGNYRPGPGGSHGIIVYDTPYIITGLQTQRQAGTEMFVAGAYQTAGQLFDDGPISLLRAGMEAQFLSGRLTLEQIGDRFNSLNAAPSASYTETWGITHTYGILYGGRLFYPHIDLALLTTMQTTTRQLLDAVYPARDISPTLILASEQRTSTLNADDIAPDGQGGLNKLGFNGVTDITLNTCLKPLVTSRSLKLQTYRYDNSGFSTFDFGFGGAPGGNSDSIQNPNAQIQSLQQSGDWVPLSLDEVLTKVEQEFAQRFPELQQAFDQVQAVYATIEDLYQQALNILKLTTTAWHLGQTVIHRLSNLDLADLSLTLDDARMIVQFLDQNGILPSGYARIVYVLLDVFEAGGPLTWLEQQFNRIVSFVEGLTETIGSFFDNAPGLSVPSAQEFLEWTRTAINLLNYLAVITGFQFLSDLARILTQVIEIYKLVRQIIDTAINVARTVQSMLEGAAQTARALLDTLLAEAKALAGSLSLVGLLIQIGLTWVSVLITLLNGSLPPLIVSTIVARAIVETIIAVAIFVIATVVPFGWVLLAVFAVIKAIEAIFGVKFDPISLFLDWFFGIKITPLSSLLTHQVGQLNYLPFDPQGGLVVGERFQVNITSTALLMGTSAGLDHSWAGVRTGFYAGAWYEFQVCVQDPSQWQQFMAEYAPFQTRPPQVNTSALSVCFNLRLEQDKRLNAQGTELEYTWKVTPYSRSQSGARLFIGGNLYQMRHDRTAYAEYVPARPRINTWTYVDVSFGVGTRAWVCSPFLDLQGECYEIGQGGESPPQITRLYFDILPNTLFGMLSWSDLVNTDPDADGLEGYFDKTANKWVGADSFLCGNASNTWDADGDGLSDKFEWETEGLSPCHADTDGDGLRDDIELLLGTDPNKADTDGDGLKDGEEVAYWDPQQDKFIAPWHVVMHGAYPGLPDPAAFPNPRHANIDGDHRSDKKERDWKTSPNAFDPVPDLPVELMLESQLVEGGGTRVRAYASPWPNDGPAVPGMALTVTLPVEMSSMTTSARVHPPFVSPQFNAGAPAPGNGPLTFAWTFPAIWQGRYISTSLAGLPALPPGPVSVTAQLVFSHAGALRVVTDVAPLLVNAGGPQVTLVAPANGAVFNGPLTIAGSANDLDGIRQVLVCVKTTLPCAGPDWMPALGKSSWQRAWTPPANATYFAQAYAIDAYGVPGPASAPITFSVDMAPPTGGSFDLSGTAWLSTTIYSDTLATVRLTGRITDAASGPSGFASGAGNALIVIADGVNPASLHVQPVQQSGQRISPFVFNWSLPSSGFGGTTPDRARAYTVTLGVSDRAGNLGNISQTLRVMIDDNAPGVLARTPQVAHGNLVTLTGRADDTALSLARQELPYDRSMSVLNFSALFALPNVTSTAWFVGDVNGDTFDDVALVQPSTLTQTWRVGLFFGRPGGLPPALLMSSANVTFTGETVGAPTAAPAIAGNLDVNGDGIADLVIGDPRFGGLDGKAYVVLGRRAPGIGAGGWPATFSLSNADWQLTMPTARGFGATVASTGDVDGDGLSDILIGSLLGEGRSGAAYLYLGRERGVPPATTVLLPPHTCDVPASNLAGVGDTNGDGLSDILIAYGRGAPAASCPGGVALVAGRTAWPASISLPVSATALFTAPGTLQTVAFAGDLDGDGLNDMLIGDPTASQSRVFVLMGRRPESPWPLPPAGLNLVAGANASFRELNVAAGPGTRLGAGLTTMGDLDRDGAADFAFGNPGVGSGPNRAAIQHSSHLSRALDQPVINASFLISGTADAQRVGEYLSSGDVNGDGVRDILIGLPGISAAVLMQGKFNPGETSGVARVEIGVSGPNLNPSLPFTATLPTAWQVATLGNLNASITPWTRTLTLPANGDYRVYARAIDRAGNMTPATAWYQGNVLVNSNPISFGVSSITTTAVALISKTSLILTGTASTAAQPQHVRVFDGYTWHRLPPASGAWQVASEIPRADLRVLTFRATMRDAFGNTRYAARTLMTDTLMLAPALSANLPVNVWLTDITPTLTVSWPAIADGSGIANRWAGIDTISQSVPITPVAANTVSRLLTQAGAHFGHVSARDGAGNSRLSHIGPVLLNRTRTPSAIYVDGNLDLAGGEYPTGTLLNYDPYALGKPFAVWGTWDAARLYLGLPGNGWTPQNRLTIYLDTRGGGLTTSLDHFGRTHNLPMRADFALVIGEAGNDPLSHRRAVSPWPGSMTVPTYTLYTAGSGGWTRVVSPASVVASGFDTEIALDRAETQATGAAQIMALAEDAEGIWGVLPGGARPSTTPVLTGVVTFQPAPGWSAMRWNTLGDGVLPNAGLNQLIAPEVVFLPGWNTAVVSNTVRPITLTVRNPDVGPYVDAPITVSVGVTAGPQLAGFVGAPLGASCASCPANAREWVIRVNVASYDTTTVTLFAQTSVPTTTGVFDLALSATLPNAALAGAAQPRFRGQLGFDHGVARPQFASGDGGAQFVRPGVISQVVAFNAGLLRCWLDLEVDRGSSSFSSWCSGGECLTITGTILSGQQVWRARTRGANGLLSSVATTTLIVDAVAPTAQITPAQVLTGATGLIGGLAQDNTGRAPRKVLVSLNGGPFLAAIVRSNWLTPAMNLNMPAQAGGSAAWALPIALTSQDGEQVGVVARAVDEAGNHGPLSLPMTVTLDVVGPALSVTQSMNTLAGTVSDGSGVGGVWVSLDGGNTYQPASVNGNLWTYAPSGWAGPQAGFALVRATDVWGNVSTRVVVLSWSASVYLPVVRR